MAGAPSSFDAIVIGAGAAGMLCAADAGKRGRRVLLIDHAAARREDPDLGRRPLQFHQPPHRARPLPLAPTRISPSPRSPATRRQTSSPWSSATASPGTKRRSANSSATAPRGRSSTCCSPNAQRAGSSSHSAMPSPRLDHADGRFRVDVRRPHRRRAGAGHRHRRPIDPQARRHRLRLRPRPPLRPEGGRAAPGAGAAHPGPRRGPVPRPVRSRRAGRGQRRQGGFPRSRLVHPSRPVGPGDPPDFVLLAPRRADRGRFPARCAARLAARRQARNAPRQPSTRARPHASRPPRRGARPNASRSTSRSPTSPTAQLEAAERRLASWRFTPTAPKASPRPK